MTSRKKVIVFLVFTILGIVAANQLLNSAAWHCYCISEEAVDYVCEQECDRCDGTMVDTSGICHSGSCYYRGWIFCDDGPQEWTFEYLNCVDCGFWA